MKILSITEAASICKMGKGEQCCAYIIAGPDGLECAKGTGFQGTIDERLKNGTIHAQGTGEWEGCFYLLNEGDKK